MQENSSDDFFFIKKMHYVTQSLSAYTAGMRSVLARTRTKGSSWRVGWVWPWDSLCIKYHTVKAIYGKQVNTVVPEIVEKICRSRSKLSSRMINVPSCERKWIVWEPVSPEEEGEKVETHCLLFHELSLESFNMKHHTASHCVQLICMFWNCWSAKFTVPGSAILFAQNSKWASFSICQQKKLIDHSV